VGGRSLQAVANAIGVTGTQVGLATSVFTPGENRLAFGVIGARNQFVYAPSAVYVARGPDEPARGPFTAPADLLVTEPAFRSQTAAGEEDPFAAIYQTQVELDETGDWSVLIVSRVGSRLVVAPTKVTVRRRSPVPDVGDRAPVVETETVADAGGDIASIDTRIPPSDMHERSFADVVGRRPAALIFAAPSTCESRTCGPVVDIAAQLKARYGDRVEFIHQEVFEAGDPSRLREASERFGLPTEPWLFTVGADGRIAARLEGSFGLRAFEGAIEAALRPTVRRTVE
jgi:hypothetical protein